MSLSFVLKVVKHCVFLRDSGSEFQTVGPKSERSFAKGLKREAGNCQRVPRAFLLFHIQAAARG